MNVNIMSKTKTTKGKTVKAWAVVSDPIGKSFPILRLCSTKKIAMECRSDYSKVKRV